MASKRKLGNSTIEVEPLMCFGGNIFGWTVDEQSHHSRFSTHSSMQASTLSIRLMSTRGGSRVTKAASLSRLSATGS